LRQFLFVRPEMPRRNLVAGSRVDIAALLAPGPLPGGDFGRNIEIFDRYLRTQAGVLARGHNPYSAVQQVYPRQNDNQLCDARRF
jgi:hypothetical protein